MLQIKCQVVGLIWAVFTLLPVRRQNQGSVPDSRVEPKLNTGTEYRITIDLCDLLKASSFTVMLSPYNVTHPPQQPIPIKG